MAGKRAKYKRYRHHTAWLLGAVHRYVYHGGSGEAACRGTGIRTDFRYPFNPILGVLVGAIVTAIIQKLVGVGCWVSCRRFQLQGAITYASAVPDYPRPEHRYLASPRCSQASVPANAKRAAFVQLYFNIIGATLFLAGVYIIQYTIGFPFWMDAIDKGRYCKLPHHFQRSCHAGLYSFYRRSGKPATLTVRKGKDEEDGETETSLLDERLLVSPGLALGQCTTLLKRMAMFARQNLLDAMGLFRSYDQKAFEHVAEVEDNIDRIEDRLGNYLQSSPTAS